MKDYGCDDDADAPFGRQLRAEMAPGDPAVRLARLLGQMAECRSERVRQPVLINTALRARNRKKAAIKLSLASALLAASLLLAAGVGLGRVQVSRFDSSHAAHQPAAGAVAISGGSESFEASLAKARQSVSDRAEALARSGQAKALAALEPVYFSVAMQIVEEASAGSSGAQRQESLIRLADTFERDSSRFSRLAAESDSACQNHLVRLATEARRLGTLARQRSA